VLCGDGPRRRHRDRGSARLGLSTQQVAHGLSHMGVLIVFMRMRDRMPCRVLDQVQAQRFQFGTPVFRQAVDELERGDDVSPLNGKEHREGQYLVEPWHFLAKPSVDGLGFVELIVFERLDHALRERREVFMLVNKAGGLHA
jgi:hypothetical protein